MKVECPKCSQRIAISPEVAAELADAATFDCPKCGAPVPNPALGEERLTPMAAEHLLMRALNTTNPDGEDWIPPEPADLDGSIGGRYHVTELIGHGGMGAVYKAKDTRLDRTVAIKILPEELAKNPLILSRFEREAKSLAALDHPHIVKIHDYGFTSAGSPFFVMEFVRGRDIQSIRNAGELDLRKALTMISQVCDAIDYAHRRKIIHRDIKPANVIVNEEGVTKVADFGLAKLLETETRAHHHPDLTITGQVMGTPAYMAPEQESGAPVDHRTDIYALGVMLYNLLTGSPPRGAWSLPSELAPVDARLDQIVLRALQEKPEARYQSASEFREDIDSVIGDSGGAALPPGTASTPLPSGAGGNSTTSRRFANQHRTTVTLKLPQTESHETGFLSTARSLNNTMLILGLLAILVIGGLAIYLATRKTGNVTTVSQIISTSETHNTFFSQLIATGITTEHDLEAVADIRPYQDGFIGISAAKLDWKEANAMALRTGATVLEVGSDDGWIVWLSKTFALSSTSSAWVLTRGDAGVLTSEGAHALKDADGVRKVLLHWRPSTAKTAPSGISTDGHVTYAGRKLSEVVDLGAAEVWVDDKFEDPNTSGFSWAMKDQFKDGRITIDSMGKPSWGTSAHQFNNFAVEVVARTSRDKHYGWGVCIYKHPQGEDAQGVEVLLDSEGMLSIVDCRWTPEGRKEIDPVGPVPVASFRKGEFNSLVATFSEGRKLAVFVNGSEACAPIVLPYVLEPAMLQLSSAGGASVQSRLEFESYKVFSLVIGAKSNKKIWGLTGEQSLIDLSSTKTEVGFWWLLAGEHPEKRIVVIKDKPRTDYLLAHAPSRVEYDIPEGATMFKALGLSTSNQNCTFSVAADGKEMFASKTLDTYEHGVVNIDVMLPNGAKRLTIMTTNVGYFQGCQTCWVEPRFVKGNHSPGSREAIPGAATSIQPRSPQSPTEPTIDVWIDTQGREIKARFLRLEGETLVINFKDKETGIPLSRLSAVSRALAQKRHAESNP